MVKLSLTIFLLFALAGFAHPARMRGAVDNLTPTAEPMVIAGTIPSSTVLYKIYIPLVWSVQ